MSPFLYCIKCGTFTVDGMCHCDSGRLPKAGADPSSAPCEASQSGGSVASASPNPSSHRPTGE